MNKSISDILYSDVKRELKTKLIKSIMTDCNEALNLLTDEYKICPICKEFYLRKSFNFETKDEVRKVCTYDSPINSGDNEYEDRKLEISYYICPKGHEIEYSDIISDFLDK